MLGTLARMIARTIIGAIALTTVFAVITLIFTGIFQLIKGFSLEEIAMGIVGGGLVIYLVILIIYGCHAMGKEIIG